ncbi:PREDICTED: uncharacterized protein LOC108783091 [Cyphomyrmex costatus]|uniref:uncharacterized protein LOC108783091 n=1 Tax=Cyphomyrmex costatus TaxID=456900 RepID=UPI00085236D6|nr:PREDICTED: uncharacterized protein LOC108783091 [Cyphomyrmex costatus]
MTPTFCWIFLLVLALVGRATSVPRPLTVDACALLCNPGAETESEQERDLILFPRYPKVNCRLQSTSDEHQAFAIMGHCLKLCNYDLSIPSEVNCFALRSSLEASIGCYCDALTPLSPNTMRLHESWRLNFLVKELAKDIMTTILDSPLDVIILCEIRDELFKDVSINSGKLETACIARDSTNVQSNDERVRRDVDESEINDETLIDEELNDETIGKLDEEAKKYENIDVWDYINIRKRESPLPENLDSSKEKTAEASSHQDQDNPTLGEHSETKHSCSKSCNTKLDNDEVCR